MRRMPSRPLTYVWPFVLAGLILAMTATDRERPLMAADEGQGNLPEASDVNPDPNIFETLLVAMEAPVDLGNGVTATAMTFNGMVPGPVIRLKVGEKVLVHFTNNLPIPASIHWHGVELTNHSDGTGITQDPVQPGGTYTYDFIAPRQGVFFYHSHIFPTNPEFKGYYGPLIVEDPNEQPLIAKSVIPNRGNTKIFIIGDTTVCKGEGLNDAVTFPANPNLPWAGNADGGPPFPGWPATTPISTPTELCDTPLDGHGHFVTPAVALPAGAIPNIQPTPDCNSAGEPGCQTGEGQLLVVNGRVPSARGGFPGSPGTLAPDARTINVKAGEGIRLQLGSATTIRYLRLRLTCPSADPCVDGRSDNQIPLFRIGGQGGLLDNVRLEGGTQGTLNTQYSVGEILLPVAAREDVVFVVPKVKKGDVLTLWTLDYPRSGPGTSVPLPTVPVAHFRIVGAANKGQSFSIAAGVPLRTNPRVNDPTESIKGGVPDALLDSSLFVPPEPGSTNPTIILTAGAKPSINLTTNFIFDEGPTPPQQFTDVPHVAESRWAAVGDLLELTIFNDTLAHHPWHPHGFSIQPVRFTNAGGTTLFEFPYNEFVDVVDIPPQTKLVYRVRLDDRPFDFNTPTGGAIGRWAMHCHIFFHAGLGMITELVALAD
jgi:FtsP/CotA-like multicopper oxidase with cupredoxin domain